MGEEAGDLDAGWERPLAQPKADGLSTDECRSLHPHILIVDDDVRYVELLALTLRRNGYRVSTALSGEEALAAAVDRPDLVLVDIVMAEMDGFEVAHRLHHVTGEATPFVFVTAKGQPHHRLIGLGMGAVEYIAKPFRPDELLEAVHKILRSERSWQEYRTTSGLVS
jgi:DNA-binding response OmpR family regulator